MSLRLPWVRRASHKPERAQAWRQESQRQRAIIDELAASPQDERTARLEAIRTWADAHRRQRPHEPGARRPAAEAARRPDDPLADIYMGRFNLWTAIDERDSAQAIEKGLSAEYEGSHTLFANDRDNWLGYDTRTLAELFFPGVEQWKRPVSGCESLVSIERAQALIGFEPEYRVAAL